MNIGFIYGLKLHPPGMGGSVHGYQLAKGLARRGHKLFSWYYGDDKSPLVSHYRGRQLLQFLQRIDVLYLRVSWSAVMSRFGWLRWLRLRRLPVVWELNGLPTELLFAGGTPEQAAEATRRLRRFSGGVAAAVGVTTAVRDYLSKDVGIRRAVCIPNGSDPELFYPHPSAKDPLAPLRVVWAGKEGCPWHALPAVVRAAEILEQKGANVIFELYTSPDVLPEHPPSNIVHCRRVPYLELGGALGRSDVGIVLFNRLENGTLAEGSPLKSFDYMACGLAIVGNREGQTGDIIREREAGLTTSGSPEDLAKQLMRLEQDRPLCEKLGRNARRAVEEYYNWDRVAAETETVLESVVSRRAVGIRQRGPSGRGELPRIRVGIGGTSELGFSREAFGRGFDGWPVCVSGVRFGDPGWIRRLKDVDVLQITAYTTTRYWAWRAAVARAMGKPVVRYWVGSDVMALKQSKVEACAAYAVNAGVALNIVQWRNLQGELAKYGIRSCVAPAPSANLDVKLVESLPERFTLLMYADERTWQFHGGTEMLMLARQHPAWKCIVVNDDGYGRPNVDNVEYTGRVTDMDSLYRRVSVLVRFSRHDGLPRMMLEAMARGIHVVWTQPFPHCRQARSYGELVRELESLRCERPNVEGREYVRGTFNAANLAGRWYRLYRAIIRGETIPCAIRRREVCEKHGGLVW